MPRTSNVTRDISQKEVHEFHPRLAVTARPVDTYVQPVMSNAASRLSKSLGLAVGTAGTLGQIAGVQNRKAQREGHEAFLRGDETPEQVEGVKKWFTAQNVKRESYMALKGQSDVVKLTPDLEAIVANTSDPMEARAQIEQLRKDFVDGSGGSVGYLSRFSPAYDAKAARAMTQVEAKARTEGQKVWQDQQATLLGNQLDGVLSSQMPKEGMTREQLLRDPEAYNEFTAGFNSADTAKLLRGTLSEMQANAKAMGISDRSAVSKFFVKEVTRYAKDYGLPELLNFTDIEDASKIKLSKVMHQDILDAKAAAISTQDHLETQAEKKQIKHRREVKESVNRRTISLIQELQLAQQDTTSEGVNRRAAVEAQLDTFLDDPQVAELSGWDPNRVEWLLDAQQRAKDPFEAPSLDLVNEGYKLWASGQMTTDWYLTNMHQLGSHKAAFATKANSVNSKEEAQNLKLTYDLGTKNFAVSMKGPVNKLGELNELYGRETTDYNEVHSAMILTELKALSSDPQRKLTAQAVDEIYLKVNAEVMTRINDDLNQASQQVKRDELTSLVEGDDSSKALTPAEKEQVGNQTSTSESQVPDEIVQRVEDPELADEPPEEPEKPKTSEPPKAPEKPKAEPAKPKTPTNSAGLGLSVTPADRIKVVTEKMDAAKAVLKAGGDVTLEEIQQATGGAIGLSEMWEITKENFRDAF